ncbi:MAG: preprotein translocase subunit YajC [Candidatus Dadabacteria bacterium]|nr:MAG: preprotein translocase subunit YajC [Candidatus Dadabacteria bacterium]
MLHKLISKILLGLAYTFQLFLTVAPAVAEQAQVPKPPSAGQVLFRMMPMFAIVFFIFYFMVLKPQEKKIRQQQALLESLKKGDQVVTDSGIFGRVAGIEKDYILLEVAGGVKIKIEPSHITRRRDKVVESKSAA